jgi:hypothetical protein
MALKMKKLIKIIVVRNKSVQEKELKGSFQKANKQKENNLESNYEQRLSK